MLAKRVDDIPSTGEWVFEPKWDGFRVLVFRDGDEILLQSRDKKSLNRYFPEMLKPLTDQLPARCILDGELVIANHGRLDFDVLYQTSKRPWTSAIGLSKDGPLLGGNGGWVRKANGSIEPRQGGKWKLLMKIFSLVDVFELVDACRVLPLSDWKVLGGDLLRSKSTFE